MIESFEQIGYAAEYTADGSPTLRLLAGNKPQFPNGESMHHSQGAASETEYIYGQCIREAMNAGVDGFIVVGLGLGYIETLLARELITKQITDYKLLSFEINSGLRECFTKWLRHEPMNPRIAGIYDQAADHLLSEDRSKQVNAHQVKEFLRQGLETEKIMLCGALEEPFSFYGYEWSKLNGSCLLYDAFSSGTDQGLWSQDFLVNFLKFYSLQKTFLSTYACTGNLKRALRQCSFIIDERPGFSGKRLSTFARKSV